MLIVAVIRGEDVLLPRGTTRLCAGDVLVVTTSDPEQGVSTVTGRGVDPDGHGLHCRGASPSTFTRRTRDSGATAGTAAARRAVGGGPCGP